MMDRGTPHFGRKVICLNIIHQYILFYIHIINEIHGLIDQYLTYYEGHRATQLRFRPLVSATSLAFWLQGSGNNPPPLFFPTAVSVLANFHVQCLSAVGFNCAVSIFNNSCGPRKNPGLLRQFLAEGDQTLWMIQSSTCMLPADTGLKGEKTILNHNLSWKKAFVFSLVHFYFFIRIQGTAL